jgi:ribosomal protein L20
MNRYRVIFRKTKQDLISSYYLSTENNETAKREFRKRWPNAQLISITPSIAMKAILNSRYGKFSAPGNVCDLPPVRPDRRLPREDD